MARAMATMTGARAGSVVRTPHSLYTSFRDRRFFGSLDGLRAISIVGVVWHHSAAAGFAADAPLVHQGNRGVNLFFVISAFLISTLLLRAKESGSLDVARFWIRRALRILPLYYAMLLAYAGLVYFVERDPAAQAGFWQNLRYFATFTSNWFVELDGRVIFFFAWSLAAEEQFYLCWPWVERWLSRHRVLLLAGAGLILTQVARWAYEASGGGNLGLKIASSVPAAILVGVMLAHVLHSRRGFLLAARVFGRRGSALVVALLVLATLAAEPSLGFAGEILVAGMLAMLVGSCVVREDNDLAKILRLKPVAWVGVISFGIYLMNMIGIAIARLGAEKLGGVASPWIDFVGGMAVTVALASASYLTYERFFLRLKDRWFADRPAAALPVSPALQPTGSVAQPIPARETA